MTSDPPSAQTSSEITLGAKIGRFVVEGELGSGGMGVVYAAHDRELDRRVALKVLRGTVDEPQRMRLMREGQAMARVTHPNVITVHEVGIAGRMVFLAQELLDGGTLRAWLEKPRSQREILDKFVAAGRGLAAAHAAGLVHRDFKPDNVLLGKDGRVRVSDFGLARSLESPSMAETTPAQPHIDALAQTTGDLGRSPMATMTRTGAVMGTPLYMSPEQHCGEQADARSDQFSFCVALYQALYGDVPFPGKTAVALADAVINGRFQPPPKGKNVPARLRKILLRGLCIKPAERYPSMDALLADITHDPGRKLRRIGLVAGIVVLIAGAVVGGYALRSRTSGQGERLASRTIAVLGFENLSGDKALDWIKPALAELIATQLASDDVRVIAQDGPPKELALRPSKEFSTEDLERIAGRLGNDAVVIGSYLQSGGAITLSVVVQDIHRGRTVRVEVKGAAADLATLASSAGKDIREALGLSSIAIAKRANEVLPKDAKAAQAYLEGREALRRFDYTTAKQRLLDATKLEPTFALGHLELARAHRGLFEVDAMGAAARRALENVGSLQPEQQQLVTAQTHELTERHNEARDEYRRLFAAHASNFEYGIALLRNQDAEEVAATAAALRKLPGGDDPMIDVLVARAELERGAPKDALVTIQRAVKVARERLVQPVLAQARTIEGRVLTVLGDYVHAAEAYEAARKLYEASRDQLTEITVMAALAELSLERGLLDVAFAHYDAVGAHEIKLGRKRAAADAWAGAAFTLALRGRIADADKWLKQAEKRGDPAAKPDYLDIAAATIAWARGDTKGAIERIAAGQRRNEPANAGEWGETPSQSLAIWRQQIHGDMVADLGDFASARKLYEDALDQAERLEIPQRIESLKLAIAQLELDEGQDAKALALAQEVQPLAATRGATNVEAFAWIVIARARLAQAASQQALEALEHVKPEPQALRLKVHYKIVDGLTHHELGDADAARDRIEAVRREADKQGCVILLLETRLARAQILPPDESKTELEAVVRDAKAAGYNRIVKLAETLAAP